MDGTDPCACLRQPAVWMRGLVARSASKTALDELEHLSGVVPPDIQDNAETLIRMLREKLAHVD